MKNTILFIISVLALTFGYSSTVSAHCEIPCGIYDDSARLALIQEHIGTIEKSINKINQLKSGENPNQLVRWVLNKEEHATELQHIVTQYFLTQRIKFDTKNYEKKLAALHQMLVYSMKCKQSTDLTNVESLKKATNMFHDLYEHK